MIDNYGLQISPDARFSVWLRHADFAYNTGQSGISTAIYLIRPRPARHLAYYPAVHFRRA